MKWNRKSLTALVFLFPGPGFALGLGNIELDSGLNQPFEARIELLSVTADELNSLQVKLADAASFHRANIRRMVILSQLRFEIVETENGSDYYIRAYSQDPIGEPSLHFLLEANWSNGRLYREYTVLLDPSLYEPDARQPVMTSTPSPAPSPTQSLTPTTTEPDPEPTQFTLDDTGNGYGPISSGDTLWSIASQTRPDPSISVQQMMLALQRANPEAFNNGNINGLKRGQMLRIPDMGEIDSMSQDVALNQARSQNDLWQDTQVADDDPELRLVELDEGAEGTGGLNVDERGLPLDSEIAIIMEQLEAVIQENIKLQEQMSEVESIIRDLERLIELKDEELAALQQSLNDSGGGMVSTPGVVTTKPVQPTGLVDRIIKTVMDNIILMGGGIVALIVILMGIALIKKRQSGTDTEASADALPDFSDPEASVETGTDYADEHNGSEDVTDASGLPEAEDDETEEISEEPALEPDSSGTSDPGSDDVPDLTADDNEINETGEGEGDFDLEMDLRADSEESASEDEGLSIDAAEESDVSDGVEIDLSIDEEAETEPGGDEEFSLELDDADELDLSISNDTDGDGEEHTVFVPRTGNSEEQSEEDEMGTKLDLAKAYVELGDKDSAKNILQEVIDDGNDEQKKQAQELLDQV